MAAQMDGFAQRVERIRRQLERGVISDEEAFYALVRECTDAYADAYSNVPRADRPELDEFHAYVLDQEWTPLGFILRVGGSRLPDGSPKFELGHPVRDRATNALREALQGSDDWNELQDVGKHILDLDFGVDLAPGDVLDEYFDLWDDHWQVLLPELDDMDVPAHYAIYVDHVATRIRIRQALIHGRVDDAIRDAHGAWRIGQRHGELLEVATSLVRGATPQRGLEAIDAMPVDEFVTELRWSPITALASLCCEAGDDQRAAELSDRVVDEQVRDGSDRYDPWRLPDDDQWGIWDRGANDVRLFGALSFIDLLTGNRERAAQRADRWGPGYDELGWHSAGHRVMAWWVMAELTPDLERRLMILKSIANTRHVWLGALASRSALEIARIHLQLGDATAGQVAWNDAALALGKNHFSLHMSTFEGYGGLALRVAVSQEELDTIGEQLGTNAADAVESSRFEWHLAR